MDIEIKHIPDALRDRDQWVVWHTATRNGTATKLPADPATGDVASTDDPDTWGAMMAAVKAHTRADRFDGIGFVFTDDDPFVGVDLDHCRDADTGEWDDWALSVLADLSGFREISPSGTGAHAIVRGALPGSRSRRGDVEMYEAARYFTVTGRVVDGAGERVERQPAVADGGGALDALYREHLGAAPDDAGADDGRTVETDLSLDGHGDGGTQFSAAADVDALDRSNRAVVGKAKSASNGEKFAALWRGEWEAVYPAHSQSEADMGFCNMLAFWCGGDPERMDAVFRASGLMRGKWDDTHYADGATYGERTVAKALREVEDRYDWSAVEGGPEGTVDADAGASWGDASDDAPDESQASGRVADDPGPARSEAGGSATDPDPEPAVGGVGSAASSALGSAERSRGEPGRASSASDRPSRGDASDGAGGPSVDGASLSGSGGREIKGERETMLEDLAVEVGEIGSELERTREQLFHDLELENDKLQRVYRELVQYEELVDGLEEQVRTQRLLIALLCRHQEGEVFEAVERAILSGEPVPVEDLLARTGDGNGPAAPPAAADGGDAPDGTDGSHGTDDADGEPGLLDRLF